MEKILNELMTLTGDKDLYIDNGGNILVKYNEVEFLIHRSIDCENLFTIMVENEIHDKHYLTFNELILEAKNIINSEKRKDKESFNKCMIELMELEKKRLNKEGDDYNIRLKQANIAAEFFTNRNQWTKILIDDYGIKY